MESGKAAHGSILLGNVFFGLLDHSIDKLAEHTLNCSLAQLALSDSHTRSLSLLYSLTLSLSFLSFSLSLYLTLHPTCPPHTLC